MNITRKEALKLTRRIYRELAITGNSYKPNWVIDYKNECPLCEYTMQFNSGYIGSSYAVSKCEKHCPLQWPKSVKGAVCFGLNGLWYTWANATTPTERKKYAKQISELPYKRKSRAKG